MHPVLFHIGHISIYAYGTMLMLAFVAGCLWAIREGKRYGVTSEQITDLTFWILIFALVFARMAFIIMNLGFYRTQPLSNFFSIQGNLGVQGLSFHGGLAGAMLGGLFFCRRRHISWLLLADICAPAAALGYGIARIGCFLNGCCYGAPTNLPWGVRFPDDFGGFTAPSHPTQIYSALGSWLIFAILLKLRTRLLGRGQLFFTYLALYCVLRFVVEFFRAGYSAEYMQILFTSLTQAQVASVLVFIVSILIVIKLRSKPDRVTQS
jgi:phosphatidylglycerol---prolipoprotein diacylglyceryl transferase